MMLPPLPTKTMVTLDDKDILALSLELTPEQIKMDLGCPTMRVMIARVKQSLMLNQDAFFDPNKGVPQGLDGASAREAYFVGLVFFGKQVLGLVSQLQEEGNRPEPQLLKPEPDPFRTGANT